MLENFLKKLSASSIFIFQSLSCSKKYTFQDWSLLNFWPQENLGRKGRKKRRFHITTFQLSTFYFLVGAKTWKMANMKAHAVPYHGEGKIFGAAGVIHLLSHKNVGKYIPVVQKFFSWGSSGCQPKMPHVKTDSPYLLPIMGLNRESIFYSIGKKTKQNKISHFIVTPHFCACGTRPRSIS